MKTNLVSLVGDPVENLYQLGLREKESFFVLEKRVMKLLSANTVLSSGQDFFSRVKMIIRKKELSFFDRCINAYSEGLGIEPSRYQSFLSLFELAAHSGQVYPELKGILPGCTSIFVKDNEEITHTRLLDFPLIGIFEKNPRLYYWQPEGGFPILTYSCEGLAPLFFQGVHGSGVSFALHHKPGNSWHTEGQSIFQIAFETLFDMKEYGDFKKSIKKKNSITKWSFLLLDKSGQAMALDIDGPAVHSENYNLHDSSPLIFTNIPLQKDHAGFEAFLNFSTERQSWLKEKLQNMKGQHILDAATDVEDQKIKKWIHPVSTLSTVGAYHINLSKGYVDIKEGEGALVKSDKLLRFSLSDHEDVQVLKNTEKIKELENAWKRASLAQSFFDQGEYDLAYHELQIAISLMPHPVWKEIFSFYLFVWDFKFLTNTKELSLVYKQVKNLKLPPALKDQWYLFIMRLEKKLELSSTVSSEDVSPYLRGLFQQEIMASRPVFATWMKLLYPRLEILDIFSPHNR